MLPASCVLEQGRDNRAIPALIPHRGPSHPAAESKRVPAYTTRWHACIIPPCLFPRGVSFPSRLNPELRGCFAVPLAPHVCVLVTNIPTIQDVVYFGTMNRVSSQAPCGGIPAAHMTSSTQSSIAKQIFTDLARARKGKQPTIKLLYVTPERLGNSDALFGIMTALHDQVGACLP